MKRGNFWQQARIFHMFESGKGKGFAKKRGNGHDKEHPYFAGRPHPTREEYLDDLYAR